MKIKIAFFYSSGCYGGLTRNLSLIISNLNLEKFSPIVVVLESPDQTFHLDIPETIPVINLGINKAFSLNVVAELKKILIQEEIKLLSSHGYKANFYSALLKLKYPKQKIITIIHGWTGLSFKLKFYSCLEILSVRLFDRIVVLSNEQKNILEKAFVSKQKIIKIPNGIDAKKYDLAISQSEALPKPEGKFIIGTCLRLSSEKDHQTLLQALSLIKDSKVECWIVGEGDIRGELELTAEKLKLSSQVKFFGYQKNLLPFYKSFDLYVSTSTQEGMPNNILEAMSAKLPIIASSLSVHQELIIDNQSGLIFQIGNEKQLAEKIILSINSPEQRRAWGESAYQKVLLEFSLAKRINALEEEYALC